MRFIAIFEDIADGSAIRDELTEAHRAFLRENKGKMRLAGAVRETPDSAPSGGVWVFDTDTIDEADAIVRQDPFFKAGLRASYKLFAWGTAPGYEDVVL
ncbi:hypothetical protein GCM10007989_20350 [Devosia pacifica]|uniref:YCII-related domain-containing protein n=1 Tax=Devosia pacifica TaxID=1335967 RepID=A0A918S4X9_9HYPH|nr:YciI family protein [Devosia pacifica]GHA24617.1 hypothetical protein GCM10007989_20350 [Devosia pacifica]